MAGTPDEPIVLWEGEWLPVRHAVRATRLWWRDSVVAGVDGALKGGARSVREGGKKLADRVGGLNGAMQDLNTEYPRTFPTVTLSSVLIGSYGAARLYNAHFPRGTAVLCTSLAAFWFYPQQYAKFFFTPVKTMQGVLSVPIDTILNEEKKTTL
jgi:hypothetical protein